MHIQWVYPFVTPLYVGSISDVELAQVSRLAACRSNQVRISTMADWGLTIKDVLQGIPRN